MKSVLTILFALCVFYFSGCNGKPTTPQEEEKLQGVMNYEDEQEQEEMYQAEGYDTYAEQQDEGEIPMNANY